MKIFQYIFTIAGGLFSPVAVTIFIESLGDSFDGYSFSTKVISILLFLILYSGIVIIIGKQIK